jgi:uncharacterized repeat protein (TIGR01451 family)
MNEIRLFRLHRPGMLIGLSVLAAALLITPAATADENATPRVNVTIQVQREVTEPGPSGQPVTRHVRVEAAGPGDVLVYTLEAQNVGTAAAFNTRLQDEIPQGTVLITESVPIQNTRIRASVDGGSTWQDFPVLIERKLENGMTERVPVQAEAYTHLEWVLAGTLEPGDQRQVSFKVQIQ